MRALLILPLLILLFALPARAQIVTVDATGDVGAYSSQAVVNGNPAISYRDSINGDLKFVRASDASGSAWAAPVSVDTGGDVGQYISLRVVNGFPAISYYDFTNGDLKYVRATDASGTSWGTPISVDTGGDVGQHTSLTVVNGNPAISYYDGTNGDLKYVRASDANGASWGTPVSIDTSGQVGLFTSMIVVNGNPAISYYDIPNGDLKYVRATDATGSVWDAPILVDGAGDVGRTSSLVVVNGNPAISYFDVTNTDLKYVHAIDASGTSWGTPVSIDTVGDVGRTSSLVVVNGNPAISYFDNTNSDLKYVRATDANGNAWNAPVIVDAPGVVGAYDSLLVVNGNPAISYYDATNTNLKFARAIDANGDAWDDTTPPDTTITAYPANPSNSADATFSFTGNDGGGSGVASFQCQLDGGGYSACSSPKSYTGLSDGNHTFAVRAIDVAGNTDATPASFTWIVDTVAPDTTITATPVNPSSSASPSFSFTGSDVGGSGVSGFQCQLDGGGYSACSSPRSYTGLSDGSHSFQVRAVDAAGNTDATPASFTWTIDATAPDTTITAQPANPSNSANATFSFTGNDGSGSGVVSFQCQIDGGGFAACSSPKSYTGLSDGSHSFQVRAIDNLSNTDATPASFTWTIDTVAPDTMITAQPGDPSNSASATFSFTGSDVGGSGVASFQCQIDGGGFTVCSSPATYTGLANGSHSFQVRAVDAAGNTDPTPASRTWVVQVLIPATTAAVPTLNAWLYLVLAGMLIALAGRTLPSQRRPD